MTIKRSVLGKGLAALIPEAQEHISTNIDFQQKGDLSSIRNISVDLIDPGVYQPRETFEESALVELANSIKEQGILQPLIARTSKNRFELIAGERRLRAAKIAGLAEVPVIIKELPNDVVLEVALIENIQRDELNSIELANAFKKLQDDFGYTQDDISKKVGKDRSTITNHLRLLKLPSTIKDHLIKKLISMGHAKVLLSIDDSAIQEFLLQEIEKEELSVRQLEKRIQQIKKQQNSIEKKELTPAFSNKSTTELDYVTNKLKRTFQTNVQIETKKNGAGEIRIEYFSLEELNRILDIIPDT